MTTPVTDTPIPDDALAASFAADQNFLPDETPADDVAPPEATDDPEADQPEAEAPTDDALPEPEAPEADQPPADPFADLLKTARPLGYKKNGTDHQFEGILDLGYKGGYIPPDKVQEVRNLIARYESNADATKELYAFRQEVERSGGLEKLAELQETNAALNQVGILLLDAIQNPEKFIGYDEHGRPVRNEREIQYLVRDMALAQKEAKDQARAARAEQAQRWTTESAESSVRQSAIPGAIHGLAEHFGLDAADTEAALDFFAPLADALLFKATPEQALEFGVAPGTLMVDRPKMAKWFQDRATLKQQASATAKARAAAAAENAKRTAPPKVAPKAQPKVNTPRAENGQFTERKRRDPSEYFEAALAGRPTPGTVQDE